MKKSVIIISSLLLLVTTFSVKAQEMTQKEKNNYAIGIILGEKIKDSGIDLSMFESISEKLNEKIDFESIKVGISDFLKGESKLSKEEVEAILAELAAGLAKGNDNIEKLLYANQSSGNESKAENYESAVARTLGSLSWYYLFIKDYKQSAQSARKALKVDNTQTWIKANLAHALLFQGRFSKAEKIYKDLSQPAKDNKTYTKSLLEDLDELEKAGVIPEKRKTDVEKIRKML